MLAAIVPIVEPPDSLVSTVQQPGRRGQLRRMIDVWRRIADRLRIGEVLSNCVSAGVSYGRYHSHANHSSRDQR